MIGFIAAACIVGVLAGLVAVVTKLRDAEPAPTAPPPAPTVAGEHPDDAGGGDEADHRGPAGGREP